MATNPSANPWGRSDTTNDLQRADLWEIDFDTVIKTFTSLCILDSFSGVGPNGIGTKYYAKDVELPERRVGVEVVRRDSRPFSFPGWDEPVGCLKVTFRVDITQDGSVYQSQIYKFLDAWRSVVRSGRGPMSSEPNFVTDDTWRPPYAQNFLVNMLTGASDSAGNPQVSGAFVVVKGWLSSISVGSLSYDKGNEIQTVQATFCCDDFLDKNSIEL